MSAPAGKPKTVQMTLFGSVVDPQLVKKHRTKTPKKSTPDTSPKGKHKTSTSTTEQPKKGRPPKPRAARDEEDDFGSEDEARSKKKNKNKKKKQTTTPNKPSDEYVPAELGKKRVFSPARGKTRAPTPERPPPPPLAPRLAALEQKKDEEADDFERLLFSLRQEHSDGHGIVRAVRPVAPAKAVQDEEEEPGAEDEDRPAQKRRKISSSESTHSTKEPTLYPEDDNGSDQEVEEDKEEEEEEDDDEDSEAGAVDNQWLDESGVDDDFDDEYGLPHTSAVSLSAPSLLGPRGRRLLQCDPMEEDDDEDESEEREEKSRVVFRGSPQLPHRYSTRLCRPRPAGQQTGDFSFECTSITQAVQDRDEYFVDSDESRTRKVAVPRLYGSTQEGSSVCVTVHGFWPYFHVEVPPQFTDAHVDAFRDALQSKSAASPAKSQWRESKMRTEFRVHAVTVTEGTPIHFYAPDDKPRKFLKVEAELPSMIPCMRDWCETGFVVPGLGNYRWRTYESDYLYVLRFMVDTGLRGMSWITLPNGKYMENFASATRNRKTDIEINVHWRDIIAHDPAGDDKRFAGHAPFRVLGYDIECEAERGQFPDPKKNKVIQIGGYLLDMFTNKRPVSTVHTLKRTSPVAGATVYWHENERDLLLSWAEYVEHVDPDMMIGYNSDGFDNPYLVNRSETLCISEQFGNVTRDVNSRMFKRNATFSSRQTGTRESSETTIEGRLVFDAMLYLTKLDEKLSSYTLNSVCEKYLNERKEDVPHTQIAVLQNGSDSDRGKLAKYCLKDSKLPVMLMNKRSMFHTIAELARVTGIPFSFILGRGQQVRVVTQIMRLTHQRRIFLPYVRFGKGDDYGQKFQGATVIEPLRGFYNVPIVTLDFASLYPSIMMAHNLCYTTLVRPSEHSKMKPDEVTMTPNGDMFVLPSVRKGLLPEVLEKLLKKRKETRAELKQYDESSPMCGVLNGRQLALKVSANSVYGFTGAQVGKLPCLEISASVTAFGREMIEASKTFVETNFTREKGYEFDAKVLYGDTDSIFVRLTSGMTRMRIKEIGTLMAREATKLFKHPIELTYEKFFETFLLVNKKMYAGFKDGVEIDTKGLKVKRRDNSLFARRVQQVVLDILLKEGNKDKAIEYVQDQVKALISGKIDIHELIVTKEFKKRSKDSKNKQGHIVLAEKMAERDPGAAPRLGDRIPFIHVEAPKALIPKTTNGVVRKKLEKQPAYMRAEHPSYVMQHGLTVDYPHILEHEIKEPLYRIFGPFLANHARIDKVVEQRTAHLEGRVSSIKFEKRKIAERAKEVARDVDAVLFRGKHMRVATSITSTSKKSITSLLASHGTTAKYCLACSTRMLPQDGDSPICYGCLISKNGGHVLAQTKSDMERKLCDIEDFNNQCRRECETCQSMAFEDILCANFECSNFFRREKARLDLEACRKKAERLGEDFVKRHRETRERAPVVVAMEQDDAPLASVVESK